jgi:hypothetical protein
MEIPEQVSVQVHEESLSQIHLVLPPSGDQLSDADLEMASGGLCWTNCPNDMGP